MGWLMDRVNPYWLVAGYLMVDAVAILTLGWLPAGPVIGFVTALVVWNFAEVGGQTGINNLATLGYPPEMRTSGIGWAGGVGRVGGIVFPLLGGLALAASRSLQTIMMITAIPALMIAALIVALTIHKGNTVGERRGERAFA